MLPVIEWSHGDQPIARARGLLTTWSSVSASAYGTGFCRASVSGTCRTSGLVCAAARSPPRCRRRARRRGPWRGTRPPHRDATPAALEVGQSRCTCGQRFDPSPTTRTRPSAAAWCMSAMAPWARRGRFPAGRRAPARRFALSSTAVSCAGRQRRAPRAERRILLPPVRVAEMLPDEVLMTVTRRPAAVTRAATFQRIWQCGTRLDYWKVNIHRP